MFLLMLASFLYTLAWGIYFYHTDIGEARSFYYQDLFPVSDTVLIGVGFYLGLGKSNGNFYPFLAPGLAAVAAMVASEVVARARKPRSQTNQTNGHIISNLIPFSNLNLMFAFGILTRLLAMCIKKDLVGVPLLSIQSTVMLLSLLATNSGAKERLRKRISRWRAIRRDLEQTRNSERIGPTAHPAVSGNAAIDVEAPFPRSQLVFVLPISPESRAASNC